MGAEHTLGRLAEESWDRFGDYDALLYEGTWYRNLEMAQRARHVSGGFREIGVQPGDRVVVMMANCPEVPIIYQALWSAGAVVTPVVFLVGAEELRHIMVNSGARALVTSPELLLTVQMATADLDVIIIVAGDSPEGTIPFQQLEQAAEQPLVDRDEDDLAALMYTGGTTGRAKGVMLTHSGLWHIGKAVQQLIYVPGLQRAIVAVPLSHAYGLAATVVSMQSTDPGQVVLMRWFEPKGWLALAAEHKAQYGTAVPAILQMLLAEPLEETALPELRYLTCGAAPLGREVLEEFERRVPGVQILEGYGLTETSAVTSFNPPGRRKVGSVGLPLPGYTVIIRDESGAPLPSTEPGEICVRSPNLMKGYWNAEDATTTALVDGELRTGDIGYMDDDGYLHIVDRKKDLIIRGGFNVFPRDVEDALVEHPQVTMAGVIGRPDQRVGEEVIAFVSVLPGATVSPDELISWARERVGKVKYPREIHIVDQIPVTSVLKLDRKALRARLKEM